MKKLLAIGALASLAASAPALAQGQAQDQSDPNPPAIQDQPRREIKPALNEAQPPAAPGERGLSGDTSGPASGSNVNPSTVVQKENPAAMVNASPAGVAGPSGTAAGSPGIEAKRGTQSGREWLPPEEVQRKKQSM